MASLSKSMIVLIVIVMLLFSLLSAESGTRDDKTAGLLCKLGDLKYGEWISLAPALRELGDAAVGPVMDMLRHRDPEWTDYQLEWNQRRAAWILGAIGTDLAVDRLLEIIKDINLHLYGRYEAIRSLRRLKAKQAATPLLEFMSDHEVPSRLRAEAAYALGDIKMEESVNALTALLEENEPRLRNGAVYALGHIGTDAAVAGLTLAFQDPDEYVRNRALAYIIEQRPASKKTYLLTAIEDPAWSVREVAVKALIKMGAAVEDDLIQVLNSPSPLLRWEAVRILGKIRSGKAMPQLIQCLKDKDWMVRNEAAVALVKIGDKTIIPVITIMADAEREDARKKAAWVLKNLK